MMKYKDKIAPGKAIAFTTSSSVFRHPYNPNASPFRKLLSKLMNFYYLRQIESEFVDFKTHSIPQ